MRRSFLTVCALITLLSVMAQAQTPPANGGRKKRVAVFDFDYATVRSNSAALFGSDVDIGKGISDLLVKYLVKDGTYSVIERKAMDKILAEQNFSNSDRANPNSAAKLGKLLGVDAIIVGSITQFGNDNKNQNVGGGGGFGRFGVGGFSHKESKAVVGLDARIVDIDTAEILGVAEGKGESTRSSTSLLGGGGGWSGFGGGNVDFGSSGFQNTIIGEAVKQAVEQMSGEVIADNSKLVTRTIVVEGLVADVTDGSQIVLNVGSKNGVKVGDSLNVERVTREIKDPATGKVLRRMTTPVGVVKVTDVDDGSSVCSVVSGSGFKVGDAVKTITQ